MSPTIRAADQADAVFVEAMLREAVNWDPGRPALSMGEVRSLPELWHYVEDWARSTDVGVVAEDEDGDPIGAAWLRFFDPDDPGFGFIDPAIPEVSIGVVDAHRGEGVGGALLSALEDDARALGLEALSLSVEAANPAKRLYERRGYREVAKTGDAVTMRLDL